MGKLKFVCPNCKALLEIDDAPGVRDKMMACPHCKFRAKVVVFLQNSWGDKNGGDDVPTQINFKGMDRTIGSLFYGNKEFSLHKGENTIGRRAQTGHAEVQLCDEQGEVDMYMSRKHAKIFIKEGAMGLEHQLQHWEAKNPIKVNNKMTMKEGDIIVLQWGDKLKFGHTELVFDRPSNGERTIIENV